MDFKLLDQIDLKLLLLSGSTITTDNLKVTPYTLEEARDYGYAKYMQNLQWLSITVDDFIESVLDEEKRLHLEERKDTLKVFDFFSKLGGKELSDSLIEILKMIFRTQDVRFLEDNVIAIDFEKKGVIYFDEDGNILIDKHYLDDLRDYEMTIIHKDNFDKLVEVVKLQNYLSKPSKKEEKVLNPADEATRKLHEEMEAIRQKVEKKKKAKQMAEAEDEDIDISDIISAVSSKSNSINILNIWKLTIYQIYDEYARLEMIDNYDFSIRAMMAGAEEVNLKHWSSKL
jgi:hypothetical protein